MHNNGVSPNLLFVIHIGTTFEQHVHTFHITHAVLLR
jgi:hypothetical protein